RKQLFQDMIEADVVDADYEAIEESVEIEEGYVEPDDS
ncbi:hypothetical protein ABIA61_005410, partial [Paenibacillus sp. RC21]